MKTSTRLISLIEMIGFVTFALVSKALVDPYLWQFSGPITLITTLILLTLYMRMRGESWAGTGLPPLPGKRAKLMLLPKALLTFGAFAAAVSFVIFLGPHIGIDFAGEEPAGVTDRWGDVAGNLPLFLLWIGIVWTSAAFGEEMFFRGFLITKLDVIFGSTKVGVILAVLLTAAFFGAVHYYYQGLRGAIMAGMIGLAFGSMFLVFGRSLWPIVIVHGVVDTLAFTSRFMEWE